MSAGKIWSVRKYASALSLLLLLFLPLPPHSLEQAICTRRHFPSLIRDEEDVNFLHPSRRACCSPSIHSSASSYIRSCHNNLRLCLHPKYHQHDLYQGIRAMLLLSRIAFFKVLQYIIKSLSFIRNNFNFGVHRSSKKRANTMTFLRLYLMHSSNGRS